MTFSNISEFEALTLDEIKNKILDLKQELFNLRLKKATQKLSPEKLFKAHDFKHINHTLKQLLTLEYKKLKLEQTKSN